MLSFPSLWAICTFKSLSKQSNNLSCQSNSYFNQPINLSIHFNNGYNYVLATYSSFNIMQTI